MIAVNLMYSLITTLDGIIAPKEVTGGLKVKETNRTVYYVRYTGGILLC